MKAESMFKVRREDLHNFTREENETLTRVGPATAMGNMGRATAACPSPSPATATASWSRRR